jgi:hypothetical protein
LEEGVKDYVKKYLIDKKHLWSYGILG